MSWLAYFPKSLITIQSNDLEHPLGVWSGSAVKLHVKDTDCHSFGHFTCDLILRIMLHSSYFIDDETEARSDFPKITPLVSSEGRTVILVFRFPFPSFPLHWSAVPSPCFYISIGLNLSQCDCIISLTWFVYTEWPDYFRFENVFIHSCLPGLRSRNESTVRGQHIVRAHFQNRNSHSWALSLQDAPSCWGTQRGPEGRVYLSLRLHSWTPSLD